MSHLLRRFAIVMFCLLSTIFCVTAYAQDEPASTTTTVVERHVIVTPVPAPKEEITVPQGYVDCFTVAAGWFGNNWIPEHRVCQYTNQAQGTVWVEGYWACTLYNADGNCTNWDWKPGRWEKTVVPY